MARENVDEFSAAIAGAETLSPLLTGFAQELAEVQGADVATALGGLVSEVDKAALTGEFANYLAASFRQAVSTGIAGWRDDDLALVKPWGFEVHDLSTPVAIWQGDEDRMVPFGHGRWLADRIPGARAHLHPGEGHLSLLLTSFKEILVDLARLAG
jgi:pimeloyl-ACP methyl ester carboxylesterase